MWKKFRVIWGTAHMFSHISKEFLHIWLCIAYYGWGKYSILLCSILFYSILFYSILFYSILFYSILFLSSSVCIVPILNGVYHNWFYCAQMRRVDGSCSLPFSSFSVISARPSIIRCPRKDDSLLSAVTNTAASLITARSALHLTLCSLWLTTLAGTMCPGTIRPCARPT